MLFVSIIALVISAASSLRCCENCVEKNGVEIENHPSLNLLSDGCGAINEDRIYGEYPAKLNEFPWLVLISSRGKAGVICLPVSRNLREGDLTCNIGTVAGWGRTVDNVSRMSEVLLKADAPIFSTKFCRYLYYSILQLVSPSIRWTDQLQNTICADAKVKYSCMGNLDGTLILEDPEIGKYVQYGIASYGMGCEVPIPSIYTDVRKYMKWILDTI